MAAPDYICGVVEGFYGRPWSLEQRRDLFRRLEKFGLNSYVYAPKDDIKHRALWRQLYNDEEITNLRLLITSAEESGIKFYYAISPGLDIDYSSDEEIDRLKIKLDQVKSLGCQCFAVLFDDIEMTMSSTNKGQFRTYAEAQAYVSNKLFEYLKEPSFLFCPTEYCESRCEPDLENSEYLLALGNFLNPKIEVLWTGPKVISRLITPQHMDQVGRLVAHRPVIWDNLFANDYDITRRLFLGPFSGRPVSLKSRTNGFLLNPNCQYEANFTPLFTLAAWNLASNDEVNLEENKISEAREVKCGTEELETPLNGTYNPEKIFQRALEHWATIARIQRPAIFYKAAPAVEERMDVAPTIVLQTPDEIDGVLRSGLQSVVEKESASSSTPVSPPQPPTDNIQEVVRCAARQAVNSLSCEYADVVVVGADGDVLLDNERTTTAPDASPPDGDAAAQFLLDYDAELADAVIPHDAGAGEEMLVEELDGETESKESNFRSCSKAVSGSSMQIDQPPSTPPSVENRAEKSASPSLLSLSSGQNGSLHRSDLALLSSFFYLPFENGQICKQTLNDLMWLNGQLFESDHGEMPILHTEEKERRLGHLHKICKLVDALCSKLAKCPNRSFVFDVYQHAYDLQGVLNVLLSFLEWTRMFKEPVMEFLKRKGISPKMVQNETQVNGKIIDHLPQGDFEPWVSRCSFLTECQVWLGLDQAFDLLCAPKRPLFAHMPLLDPILRFRPLNWSSSDDRRLLYDFLYENLMPQIVENWSLDLKALNLDDQQFLIEILGDRFLGPFFDSKIQYCFICSKVDYSDEPPIVNNNYEFTTNDQQETMIGFCSSIFDNQSETIRKRFLSKMKLKYEMEYKSRRLDQNFDPDIQDQKMNFLLKFLVESFDDGQSTSAVNHPKCPQIFKSWLSSSDYYSNPDHVIKNYQSYVKLMFSPEMCCQSLAAPKRTLMAALAALKKIGSNSVFSRSPQNDDLTKDLFLQMGFHPIEDSTITSSPRIVFYGRRF